MHHILPSLTMQKTTIKQLLENAKDIDHDLRFMALSDLHRALCEDPMSFSSLIDKVIDTLVQSLEDIQPEVQTQAVQSFKPLMSICDEANLITIVAELNKKPKEKSITSSIHTMALCVCLENMKPLNPENIVRILSPIQIDCIDAAEVVYRLIKYLGSGIQDLASAISVVIFTCFQSDALIAKRAISSLAELGRFADRSQFEKMMVKIEASYNEALKSANGNFELIPQVYKTKTQIYTNVFQVNPSKLPIFIADILQSTGNEIMTPNTDDDYDQQTCLDNVRIYAFVMLTEILSVGDVDDSQSESLISLCNHFFAYGQDDEMEESDVESMESFDDSEEYEQSLTWKIRLESVKLANIIVSKKPQNLPLVLSHLPVSLVGDENAMVACEAVKLLTATLNMVPPFNRVSLYTQKDNHVTETLRNESKSLYRALCLNCCDPTLWVNALETLVVTVPPEDGLELVNFARSVVSGQPLIHFYGVIVRFYFCNLMVEDLVASLQPDSHHAVVSESIKTCLVLLQSRQPSSLLMPLQRICVSKAYPLEIRHAALETLAHFNDESVFETAHTCLGYSSLAETACFVLSEQPCPPQNWVQPLCDSLKDLMKDPDNAFCLPAIAKMSWDNAEILQLILSMHFPKKYATQACLAISNFFGVHGLGLMRQVAEALVRLSHDDVDAHIFFQAVKIVTLQKDMIPLLLDSGSPLACAAVCMSNNMEVPATALRYAILLGYPFDKNLILSYEAETAGTAMSLSGDFFLQEFASTEDDTFFLRAFVSALRLNDQVDSNLSEAIVEKVGTYTDIKETEISLAAECLSRLNCFSFYSEKSDALEFLAASTIKLIFSSSLDATVESIKPLQDSVEKMCHLVLHSNLSVKQAAVNGLIVSLHNNALITLPVLSVNLAELMEKELLSKKEYTRTLQIGPFKHKIDDGLELRKSIYEMVYTVILLAEKDPEISWIASIDYYNILNMFITKGLKDDNSVVQLCCITIQKLAALHPELFVVSGVIPNLIKYASRILKKTLKESATKQEVEKHAESVRAISRTFSKVDTLELEPQDHQEWVQCKQDLGEKLV